MKYSIVTLLAATAYCAILAAAIGNPDSIWRVVAMTAALCLFTYFVVLAFDSRDHGKALFGRVAVFVTVTYVLVSLYCQNTELDRQWDLLPHERLTIVWYEAQPPAQPRGQPPSTLVSQMRVIGWARKTMRPFFCINCALALGIIGGSLALWRYRRNEQPGCEGEQQVRS